MKHAPSPLQAAIETLVRNWRTHVDVSRTVARVAIGMSLLTVPAMAEPSPLEFWRAQWIGRVRIDGGFDVGPGAWEFEG